MNIVERQFSYILISSYKKYLFSVISTTEVVHDYWTYSNLILQLPYYIRTTSELARIYHYTDLDETKPESFKIPDKSNGITQR